MPNKVSNQWFIHERTPMFAEEFKKEGWTKQVVLSLVEEDGHAFSYFFLHKDSGEMLLRMRGSNPENEFSRYESKRMKPDDIRDYYKCLIRALKHYNMDYIKLEV